MAAKKKNVVHDDPTVLEARRELARRIAVITGIAGEHVTAVAGVILYHRDEPTPCYRASYEPSLNIFVQGRKDVTLGQTEYVCLGRFGEPFFTEDPRIVQTHRQVI